MECEVIRQDVIVKGDNINNKNKWVKENDQGYFDVQRQNKGGGILIGVLKGELWDRNIIR